MFYGSPEEESAAVLRAAARAGVRVGSPRVERIGGALHARRWVDTGDGWGAARFLLALTLEDAETPGARDVAEALRRMFPSDEAFATAVHRLVKERVRFLPEVGEVFQNGGVTLAIGYGDCDDHARLASAIGAAGGLPVELVFLHRGDGGGPTHALASLGGAWAETTLDAELGEHPYAAALRLGLISERDDVARESVIMTEKDLPPAPAGYLPANPDIRADVAALVELGFLCEGADLRDAADPVFREALLAFQLQAGIVADGLIGPQSRRALATMLREGDTPPMGEIGAELSPVKLTGRLSRRFFRLVAGTATALNAHGANLKPEMILALLFSESGLNPAAPNGAGAPYYGLNQMGVEEQRGAGFTGPVQSWLALSAEDQYVYVDRFLRARASVVGEENLTSVGALYLMNWLPYAKGPDTMAHASDPDFVLATEADDPHGYFKSNRVLDVDGNGAITVGDLTRFVAKRQQGADGAFWIEARRRLYEEVGQPPDSLPPDYKGIASVAFLLATSAIAAWQVSAG